MALRPEEVFHPSTPEYYDGQHYVKTCSLCGVNVPIWSTFQAPHPEFPHPLVFMTGAEIHIAFHERLPAW